MVSTKNKHPQRVRETCLSDILLGGVGKFNLYKKYTEIFFDPETFRELINRKVKAMNGKRYYTNPDNLREAIKQNDKLYLIPQVNAWIDHIQKDGSLFYPVLLGLALYGEARGENLQGKQAVVEVVFNRCRKRKASMIETELLKKLQFSCFNREDKSLVGCENLEHQEVISWCALANGILSELESGSIRVLKSDTTIYLTKRAFQRVALDWALEKKHCWDITKLKRRGVIGNHIFFAE